MGPIGLSVEEENLRAAPGTPQAAQAEGGMLYAKIVPKSNMKDAIKGETMDITMTKGYFTEAEQEAKIIARGAMVPKELECFLQDKRLRPRRDRRLGCFASLHVELCHLLCFVCGRGSACTRPPPGSGEVQPVSAR